jgi:DNA-binding NarL/FixJ family response regulator
MISSKTSGQPASGAPPLRVLIVERAAGLRERLAGLLAEVPGLRVAGEASSVPEALSLLRQASFDAVLLDVDLGAEEGFRALAQIRREAAGSSLVVLSDDGEPEIRERCWQLGADSFFVTSLEFDRIGGALLALGRQRALRARGGAR